MHSDSTTCYQRHMQGTIVSGNPAAVAV